MRIRRKGVLLGFLCFCCMLLAAPMSAEAAKPKAVKSVSVKIGGKKVTKKTYSLTKGKTASLKVTVKPSKARKSVSYKSSNKKIATVSKKGKVTAKKTGTAKIKITVKGKNGKKKSTWVKIKVTAAKKKSTAKKGDYRTDPDTYGADGHVHRWVEIRGTKTRYVVDEPAWYEYKEATKVICQGVSTLSGDCELQFDTTEEWEKHAVSENHGSYKVSTVILDTIFHEEVGHTETYDAVVGYRCSICGKED